MKYRYGKVALIIGASSGVGKEIANYLKASGYIVYGTSRKAIYDEDNYMIPFDVTKEETIKEAVKYIMSREKEINILVNCPGYGLTGAVEDISLEEAKDIFNTNLFGIMMVQKNVLPIMRKQRKGLIINISSVAGFISIPYQSMYSASKYALEAVTEALRMEVKQFGIKVSMIEPGDMKTNFYRVTASDAKESVYKETCESAVNEMIRSEHNGPSAIVVVKEFKKILRRKNPPIRKIVGWQYKLIGFLKKILPAKLVEYVVSKIYS